MICSDPKANPGAGRNRPTLLRSRRIDPGFNFQMFKADSQA